ncbi:MAG: hypothetical protein Q9170_000362 [Blastenia crenularia]
MLHDQDRSAAKTASSVIPSLSTINPLSYTTAQLSFQILWGYQTILIESTLDLDTICPSPFPLQDHISAVRATSPLPLMATATQMPMSDPVLEDYLTPASPVNEAIEQRIEDAHPEQNRSSSLSDIDDRADEDAAQIRQNISAADSDQNDTEAETERLEDSPQKLRKTQTLVLTAADSLYNVSQSAPIQYQPVVAQVRRGSDEASFSDSSIEDDPPEPVFNSPRKRKRSEVDYQDLNDQRTLGESRHDSPTAENNAANARLASLDIQPENNFAASDIEDQESEEDTQRPQSATTFKGKRGKRRTRKASDGDARMDSPSARSVNGVSRSMMNAEAPDSNFDDAEMDDVVENTGLENSMKDEESSMKKKSAIDSLSAIERCFASLREKLYDERLAKCDAELAMLGEPSIAHPELLSMKEVLEQRREEKIQYERKLIQYKLGSLQNKSKAEKAQVHGQYLQSVREIRDWNLKQANKEWYQIHKERRSRDDDVPEYMYQFPTRRSQQIINQTAYNKEVSLLSGIAKYRGFPAAPEIRGAAPSEIDSDFEKMGIVQQPPAPLARHPPPLRASLSANAVLPRSDPVADEHFFEQNPWANPQHAAHLHRQASGISRTASPLVTTASKKRPTEASGLPNEPSTLSEAVSRPHLPIGAGPATSQQDRGLKRMKLDFGAGAEADAYPRTSHNVLSPSCGNQTTQPENHPGQLERPKMSSTIASDGIQGRHPASEMHVKPYIPKMARKADSPRSLLLGSKLPISPSSRFPNIKAEDISRLPGRSPTPQQYHRPVSVNVTAAGAGDRFAAARPVVEYPS